MTDKLNRFFLKSLRLTQQPTVKVYRGFGNEKQLTIFGHVLRQSALPRKKYRDIDVVNLLAVLRLFLVRPYPHALVRVYAGNQFQEVQTDATGYFRVDFSLDSPLPPGWHPVRAQLISQTLTPEKVLAEGEGKLLIPHPTQLICISDIDDTFLISHSATMAKRLQVLLTENAHSRVPFEGVVAHYKLLAEAGNGPNTQNPFFYVSSSEWNLYDYIREFSVQNQLPDGVYLLSPLRQLREVLKTGRGNHHTKFDRIAQVMQTYPDRQVILLGDDSQQDPAIYKSVVEQYPGQIRVVYIRQIHARNKTRTQAIVEKIKANGVPCCYFAHSAEARQHSVDIGLTDTI